MSLVSTVLFHGFIQRRHDVCLHLTAPSILTLETSEKVHCDERGKFKYIKQWHGRLNSLETCQCIGTCLGARDSKRVTIESPTPQGVYNRLVDINCFPAKFTLQQSCDIMKEVDLKSLLVAKLTFANRCG